jgi:hypothetical protein
MVVAAVLAEAVVDALTARGGRVMREATLLSKVTLVETE